ncbi:capsular biosynthesis protein [Clostridium tertium]|uniref:capsular biosynthesis protein n=1 Tax=Clostridium tertium TaxID=1559 RepID=UPI00232DFAFA|nr:capsular biosynthesis protein [Clostridium tertium]MDB1944455.1 capsular biosynthesis protein [Clostridium tertium]MDB1951722.1 capsular biosynthesis protein [Clostridium tertium]
MIDIKINALIVLADNIYLTPYINLYISILNRLNINYKVIYWDKNNNEYINDSRYIRYSYKDRSKVSKIIGYIKYRSLIINNLKKKNYTIIIPLHGIVSFILFDVLMLKFKNRYIYDIRDYSYEKLLIYRIIQRILVNNSMINIISSKGYKEFLPKGEYFITHNIPYNDYKKYKQYEKSSCSKISISYIGLIRFMEQNKRILRFFKNDNRFHLNFIGTNAMGLKEFCERNNIYNVTLKDTFNSSETLNYYKDTDLIMNLYGNKTPLLDYALSNKLYYSACLYKPILVCEGTYMEKISKEYGIGFTLSMNNIEEKDILYKYIFEMKRNKFIDNCNIFMKEVYEENSKLEIELTNRLENIKEKVEIND